MTVYLHHLRGCAPAPLAHYLKALGILRLVAQQKDFEVRGFWRDEHFCLVTSLDRDALEKFFREEYAPTAIANPWGARSGFYSGGSERSSRQFLATLNQMVGPRFTQFAAATERIRAAVRPCGDRKPETDEGKLALLARLRASSRGATREWLDTAVAMVGEKVQSAAIFGTGGNEGSGGYPAAYMNALIDCLVRPSAHDRLQLAETLFGSNTRDGSPAPQYRWKGNSGQFVPDKAHEGSRASAWDVALTFEGAIAFNAAVVKRSETQGGRLLAAPFVFPHDAFGTGTDATIDEYAVNKGVRGTGRGEQWFPLWTHPASYEEVSALIREGRCVVGRRSAARPLEAAVGVGLLGVARGLSGFLRYGYLQRDNLATHFAVPLGRIEVREATNVRCLDDIQPWLGRLRRSARAKNSPARLESAERRVANAAFAAADRATPMAWQALLVEMATVEALQASGTGFEAGPVPRLSPGWLQAADDGSSEWRLAIALGSAAAKYRPDGLAADPVRSNVLPLKDRYRYEVSDKRLTNEPRVVATGRNALADLAAIVERRLVDAAREGQRHLPLVTLAGHGAQIDDLAALLDGEVDVERTLWLARALMALDWRRVRDRPVRARRSRSVDEAWIALRLSGNPFKVAGRQVPLDIAVVRRLLAGDVAGGMSLVLRRLQSAGFRPPLLAATADAATSLRWVAALAFPIDPSLAERLATQFLAPTDRAQNQTEIL